MKGIGKRLLALTLCIFMICLQMVTVFAASVENCPGGCTHLAAIGTTHYDTLEEAIGAAEEGSTVTLLADIPSQAALQIEKAITLDLGGKTLTGQNTAQEGLLSTSKDFTLRNGTLTTATGACLVVLQSNVTIENTASLLAGAEAYPLMINANAPTLVSQDAQAAEVNALIQGQLRSEGAYPAVYIAAADQAKVNVTVEETASVISSGANALEFHGNGNLTVTGGTFQGKDHAIVLDIPKDGTMEASITDGLFTSEKAPVLIQKAEGATAPSGFITGGTFTQNPADYVASHCRAIQNSDGTYTVVSAFTLTFQANGGSGTMKSLRIKCGKSVKLPKCGFTAPKGKVFAGWKIGSKTYAAGKTYTPKDNVTITAQWKNKPQSSTTNDKKPTGNSSNTSTKPSTGTKPHTHKLKSVASSAPTCTAKGMNSHQKCTLCGKLFVSGVEISARALTIPSLGHNWETVEGYPATCLEDGLKEHQKCTECGKLQRNEKTVKKAKLVIPAGAHTLESVPMVSATCKEAGMAAHDRCTVCDQLFVGGQVVEADSLSLPVISHVLSDWYSDETEHWKSCVNCSEVFRQKAHADPDADGICNDCGYTMPAPQQEGQAPEETESGFNWLFLIPIVAAVAVAVPLGLKKRK